MPLWLVLVIATAALFAVLALAFLIRLRTLGLRVGSFECALRTSSGWASGLAHYGRSELAWYRVVSLSPRPARRFRRSTLAVLERTYRAGEDGPSGVVEIECETSGGAVQLAMRSSSYSGFASWLEALPPREETAH